MRLKGKVAVITGGASGIGRSGALVFAREGAKVVVADIAESGREVAEAIVAQGGDAMFVPTDVSSAEQAERMAAAALERYGRIDVLFNNAMWYRVRPLLEVTLEEWRRTLDVTLTGTFLCCKAVLPAMIAGGGGSIINTSSTGGTVGFEAHSAYSAAKAGVNLLTRSIAIDYGKMNIRANTISPGIVATPNTQKDVDDPEIHPYYMFKCLTGRVGRPEDIAYAAVYLASDEAAFVTGTNLFVDNGWTAR
ncbi:SDR family NAD(P)-dependent oxidoreductase [Paenibacillus cymbidii]|uniref:SDR family NAD(P)-dependent oxidoreductase n=1 Tax=Paenibacillus cymbidii TaxID=1639034 RepID=UPI00108004A7|nr:SDR family oxidoreductase [Paenibacillus cymbidii]